MKYQLYIIKKFYEPIEIEAKNPNEAEERAYEWMEANNTNGKYDSDDTYIYFDGELEEQT
jgi:hypothetical protein